VSSSRSERIPFQVDISRIIEVLAKQIYQSSFALLRENTQNAFDAVLMRQYRGDEFVPEIAITLRPSEISIRDNGIGMTPDDLREHYWRAGASGKNNPEARAAGVVGTFGIGAMANFGIADELVVETESAVTGQRTRTSARRANLSTTEDCIEMTSLGSGGNPGTIVTARIADEVVDVAQAEAYVREFVAFVAVAVIVNGELVSKRPLIEAVGAPEGRRHVQIGTVELGNQLVGALEMRVAGTGEVWLDLVNLSHAGEAITGRFVLRQGSSSIRTFRSGFGLAGVGVSSHYQFGGAADLLLFEPTAGREALTSQSMQVLQTAISALDRFASEALAELPEADMNTSFMNWVRAHKRYELCENLNIRIEPGNDKRLLSDVRSSSESAPALVFSGADKAIIDVYATDDRPLLVLSTGQPRRTCEQEYLQRFCKTERVHDTPTVLEEKPSREWTLDEQAFVFRVASTLKLDYFLAADVSLGKLSHGLPAFADEQNGRVRLVIDPDAPTASVVCKLYREDLDSFTSMVKDFIRNVVFPKVSDYVPSSTRQGAEAFLKSISRTRDVFEYQREDMDSLSAVWRDYVEGILSMQEAADRSTYIVRRNVQELDRAATATISEVVPGVVEGERVTQTAEPLTVDPAPSIIRSDITAEAKMLLVEGDGVLKGYRTFIALSDRVREERGEFFLQPHSTAVVWSGQKVLFVFEHHSGQF
jgi:molecular chaperone HtpG